MHYDYMLSQINGWGKYQKWLCLLLTLSTVPNGYFTMVMVFTSKTPEHRCRILEIDGLRVENETSLPIYNASNLSHYIPWNEGKNRFHRCKRYENPVFNDTAFNNDTVKCDFGFVYDIVNGELTAVTEWDLVCDDASIKPRITSLYMAGVLIGSFISGAASDWFGRWPVLIISTYLQFVFMGLNAVCVSHAMYALFMFLAGGCSLINFVCAVVLSAEIIDASHRALIETFLMVGFSIGYAILPLFAYFILDWKVLMLVLGLTGVLFIPYWWLMPESPRWLITKKKFAKAHIVLKKIAKINGCSDEINYLISEENLKLISTEGMEEEHETSKNRRWSDKIPYINLFIKPGMLKRILIMSLDWFVISLTYFTVNLNTGNMGGNDVINCFISACVEIPAYVSTYVFLRNQGRRWLLVMYLLLSATACVATPFTAKVSEVGAVVTAMIGKFFMTSAFGLVYLYTTELFPTEARNQAIGITSICARLGSVIVPYIIFLGDEISKDAPYLIIAACAFSVALLNCLLPETRGIDLPDTYEEANNLKRQSFIPISLKKRFEVGGYNNKSNSDQKTSTAV